jgi:hypothetical protein
MDDFTCDFLKLGNQLCFPLYAASREVIKQYKPFLDELDLTYTQYIAMMLLWEYKAMTVKEIGSHLYLDSGTLTPLLKKLEAKGWAIVDTFNTGLCDGIQMSTIASDGIAYHCELFVRL